MLIIQQTHSHLILLKMHENRIVVALQLPQQTVSLVSLETKFNNIPINDK